ncbi:MAG: Uma2 family endonuclease [Gemmataceae bacterium]|nr:Uma2 family endonuclease [Gemmataceae bacterium]
MTPVLTPEAEPEVFYPESDGKPMADNQRQFRCIARIYYGIAGLLRERKDVFVATDLLWYPRRGDNTFSLAPDVMVAFGRPQRFDVRSYFQWLEGGVCPQFVVEVLSHNNTRPEMDRKRLDYEDLGVEEYVQYDPETNELEAYRRGPAGGALVRVVHQGVYECRLLPVRFDARGDDLEVFGPGDVPFLSAEAAAEQFEEMRRRIAEAERDLGKERERAEKERERAEKERERADGVARELGKERERVEKEREAAERERERALAVERDLGKERERAEQEREAAERERERADGVERDLGKERERAASAERDLGTERRRAERMAALVGLLLAGQASPEQIDELRRLQEGNS